MYKILLLIYFLFFLSESEIFSQALYSEGSLKGLDIISSVLIENIDSDLLKDGLNEKFLQTSIEVKLRMAGINLGITDVLESLKYKATISRPELYVVINSIKNYSLNIYALSISLMLREDVKLLRSNNETRSTIWQASITAVKPASKVKEIEEIVKDLCDIFINDYLKENPKK